MYALPEHWPRISRQWALFRRCMITARYYLLARLTLVLSGCIPARAAAQHTLDQPDWSVNPGATVTGVVKSGDTLYMCGNFLTVGRSCGSGSTVASLTGQPIQPFPRVAGSILRAI